MPRWKRPKPETPIEKETLPSHAIRFPRAPFISPFEKFWQEHRHEEADNQKRKRMDKIMEKYT